jgi:Tfp pilus assembly protein PilX
MTPRRSRQRGATLMVSMIMLLLITLLTIASFKLGKGNLQIVNNMQQRSQTQVAAQSAIELAISSPNFAATPNDAIPIPPAAAVPTPCSRLSNTTCVDVNGDGITDVTVALASTCVRTQVISNAVLDLTKPKDVGCSLGASQNFGIAGATNNNSLCADMLWDLQAVATDAISNAQSTIHQGVTLRQPATAECP